MRSSFRFMATVLILALMGWLSISCDGKQGPAGPAGQSVTIYVTATPSVSHPFLGQWGGSGTFNVPNCIAVDGLGNLYVTDYGFNRVQKFTSGGNPITVWGGLAAGTAAGQFYGPYGVGVDKDGNLYVADSYNNRIQELPTAGSAWITTGGTASGTGAGQFNFPDGVAVDDTGNLYVADGGNGRIQELPAGQPATLSASWVTFGFFYADLLNPNPYGIAIDKKGNLFAADYHSSCVQYLPSGKAATVSANWVTFGSYGSNPGQFSFPYSVAVDDAGNLYVADFGNNRIQELLAGRDGAVSANWVTLGGTATGTAPGQFSGPMGVAVDDTGNLYVADTGNKRIQKFGP